VKKYAPPPPGKGKNAQKPADGSEPAVVPMPPPAQDVAELAKEGEPIAPAT
jgi:tyrosyl-tRNA synthetase